MMDILTGELADAQAQIARAITAISRSAHTLSLMLEDCGGPSAAESLARMFAAAQHATNSRAELSVAAAAIAAIAASDKNANGSAQIFEEAMAAVAE